MLKNLKLHTAPVASIGEEIGLALGNQMVKDYQSKNDGDVFVYQIGRDIIDQILSQPGCLGLNLYNAYNEKGEKTLVYAGIDFKGKSITTITSVNQDGTLISQTGIIGDRTTVIRDRPGSIPPGAASDADDWGWTID